MQKLIKKMFYYPFSYAPFIYLSIYNISRIELSILYGAVKVIGCPGGRAAYFAHTYKQKETGKNQNVYRFQDDIFYIRTRLRYVQYIILVYACLVVMSFSVI